MADKYIYYRHEDGRFYRVRADFWQHDGSIDQRVWAGARRRWIPTSEFFQVMVREETLENLLDQDPFAELESIHHRYGHLVPHTLRELTRSIPDLKFGSKFETVCRFAEVERFLGSIVENLRVNCRSWLASISLADDYGFVLYVWAGLDHSVSAELMDYDSYGDYENEFGLGERLPLLGWEWPSFPMSGDWFFHDELMNSGIDVSLLALRTLKNVFDCNSDTLVEFALAPES